MLSDAELYHFAVHGWVLQENVFTAGECEAFKTALDIMEEREDGKDQKKDSDDIRNLVNMVNYDPVFREWIMHPNILPVIKQLLGTPPRFECCHAMIKLPHPERKERREELSDPSKMGWHRGIRPKYGTVQANNHPYINTTFLNNITYLTDVDPENGGTMALDGSHRIEAKDWSEVFSPEMVVQISAKAGSVLRFTEALIHTGVPILSERIRYTMFYGFTPPWMQCWPGCSPAEEIIEQAEGELKEILGARTGYMGQYGVE
ncbi:MAG: phytanoyl-CoA dioxygenase family protein [Planctomycetota bacterium]|jgi:ectoine hydroxylase-related dioxygenase (phytanoyl-CoA dioxygenase family)|nr:phytanoyl-CoA dioxygenase family protein [Planctomycetota bacterium]